MEAEYDSIAEEYDATRESASPQEVEALVRSLGGCTNVLDVGVGTGRFAVPLSSAHYVVTGVDVSRRMLLKARGKGLDRILLGDAYSLPFKDKSFDAAVIIRVLHVVADWVGVMREIGRVTRGPVVSVLRVPLEPQSPPPSSSPSLSPGADPGPRQVSRERTQHRMWQNELELKSRVPPLRLERIRDETMWIPVADAVKSLHAKRAAGAQIVPPEVKREMLDRIVALAGGQSVPRRIVEDLAVWRADDLQALG
jgi:SAM-dependent methyltransferase